MIRYRTLLSLLFVPALAQAQIVVDNTLTPVQLVQNILLGQGVTVSNIQFNGSPGTNATEQMGSFGGDCNVGLASGVVMATGDVHVAEGPNDEGGATLGGGNAGASDPDLVVLAGNDINDVAILEFDFIPTGDSLKFDFVFASEEYPDYVCSEYNDVFGFFLSGPGISGPFTNNAINIALIPGTNVPVAINTVNSGVPGFSGDGPTCALSDPNWDTHTAFFIDNGSGSDEPSLSDDHYIQFNGFTVVLRALARVTCGQQYHIKLAIGDSGDEQLDSSVFLQAGSFASTGSVIPHLTTTLGPNDSTMYEGCGTVFLDFERLGDTSVVDTVDVLITGSATAGVDYSPALPNRLVYEQGDSLLRFPLTIPLDADGLEQIRITITQNIVCSGSQLVNDYNLYIDSPPAIDVVTQDIIGTCGQAYDLVPQISGGTVARRILWSTGATTSTINVQPAVTTTYYFTVSDTCGVLPVSDSITVTLPVYPPLDITLSPDIAIPCLESDALSVVSATGGNGSYTYAWTRDGQAAGTGATITVPASDTTYYAVTVTEGCGSSVTDSIRVSTAPLPDIEIMVNDITVMCPGDTVVLRASATGGNSVYTFSWRDIQGVELSTADTLQVAVPSDAAYHVVVNDQCGYMADSTAATLLPHYDPFVLSMSPDTLICEYDTVQIQARVTGGSGYYTLQWPGHDDWSDPQYTVSPYENTTYSVVVEDACGAVLTDEVQVDVEHPRARILIMNKGQDDWLFQAQTLPYVCNVYRWDLGDLTLSREDQVYHSYVDLLDHWVHLHVVSFNGCEADDSLLVTPPAHIYFPNTFTPDGDGVNEMFGPVGHNIEEFAMSIYDRWGHLVFESEEMTKFWDGKVNGGAEATTGVYIYRYRAKGHYFEADESYGHVTLLRGSMSE